MNPTFNWLVEKVRYINDNQREINIEFWKSLDFQMFVSDLVYNLNRVYQVSDPPRYRISQLGKPWLFQVLDVWFPIPTSDNKSNRSAIRFADGYFYEFYMCTLLAYMANKENIPYAFQVPVQYPTPLQRFKLNGTADMILNNNLVVEFKALAPNILRTMCNSTLDYEIDYDMWGYATQLSMYSYCTQLPCCFLFKDKETSELSVKIVQPKYSEKLIQRVIENVPSVDSLSVGDLDTLFERFPVPKLRDETLKKKRTGRQYIRPELRKSFWVKLCYEVIEVDASKEFVTIRSKQELVERASIIKQSFKDLGYQYEV